MIIRPTHFQANLRLFMIILCILTFLFCLFVYQHQNRMNPISTYARFVPSGFSEVAQPKTLLPNTGLTSAQSAELEQALDEAQEREFKIVVWNVPSGNYNHSYRVSSRDCGRCQITNDMSQTDDPKTKAVIFLYNTNSTSIFPKNRRSDQLYIWMVMESGPALLQMRNLTYKEFDNFFNLTATPRRDSGVYWPYDNAENVWYFLRHTGSDDPHRDINLVIYNKTSLAIWVVSNCGVTRGAIKRLDLVNKLVDAGLNVDRRGRCFSNPLESLDIIRNYKFYLAFENGYHCKDYITEKLFRNGYSMGTVPVVWGATKSDYEALAPPNSFIHADDFKTIDDLVKYLNYLDKNDTAYREYFLWRTKDVTEMPQYGRKTKECHLCRIINGINVDNIYHPNYEALKTYIPMFGHPSQSITVPSVWKWYYGTDNPECYQQEPNNFQNYLNSFS